MWHIECWAAKECGNKGEKNHAQCICRLQHEVTLSVLCWIDDIRHFYGTLILCQTEKMNWQEPCRSVSNVVVCRFMCIFVCLLHSGNVVNDDNSTFSTHSLSWHLFSFLYHRFGLLRSPFLFRCVRYNDSNNKDQQKLYAIILIIFYRWFLNSIELNFSWKNPQVFCFPITLPLLGTKTPDSRRAPIF